MTTPEASVRWMHDGMAGAPVLSNNWGDLAALLRACCVDGFNVRPVQAITCTGTEATVQCAGHGFLEWQVVRLSGAQHAACNGDFRVTRVAGANAFCVELGEAAPPAAGAGAQGLSARAAPLGFEVVFDAGSKFVLRSTDVQSERACLRVDDTAPAGYPAAYARFARVTAAQAMTDVDTFVGARAPFAPDTPTLNEATSGTGETMYAGWFKWLYAMSNPYYTSSAHGQLSLSGASAGPRKWFVVGDARGFYAGVSVFSNTDWPYLYAFGDVQRIATTDPFATMLCAVEHALPAHSSIASGSVNALARGGDYAGNLLLRNYHGEGLPVKFRQFCAAHAISSRANWPNQPGDGLLVSRAHIMQADGNVRGTLPGMHVALHAHDLPPCSVLRGAQGRDLLLANVGDTGAGESRHIRLAFDITGPWQR